MTGWSRTIHTGTSGRSKKSWIEGPVVRWTLQGNIMVALRRCVSKQSICLQSDCFANLAGQCHKSQSVCDLLTCQPFPYFMLGKSWSERHLLLKLGYSLHYQQFRIKKILCFFLSMIVCKYIQVKFMVSCGHESYNDNVYQVNVLITSGKM